MICECKKHECWCEKQDRWRGNTFIFGLVVILIVSLLQYATG